MPLMHTLAKSVSRSVSKYIPSQRHLAGLAVVLIGGLLCLWLNTSLNIKGQPIVNDVNDGKAFTKKYGVKVL